MKTETKIVLIPTHYCDARYICDLIGGMQYANLHELKKDLRHDLGVQVEEDVLFYSLSDFMEECNDQVIDLDGYFITYIQIV